MSLLKACQALFRPAPRISLSACAHRVRCGDAFLVDVREAREWTRGVAERAVLLPLSDLQGARTHWHEFLANVGQREILIYCASGLRSGQAARMLAGEGFRAANTGGLAGWEEIGWPVVKPAASRQKPR